MDIQKFIKDNNLESFPIGIAGCKISEDNFDSCNYDVVVFDDNPALKTIVRNDDETVIIHHASLSETESKKLLQYQNLQIIQDESWNLQMLLSKINQKKSDLFFDFARNSLIESIFCCQKTQDSIQNSNAFGACWQKCASFHLLDAILSLNQIRLSPSHMLGHIRKFKKNPINEYVSVAMNALGIERATPTLLGRMMKSTVGFSNFINNHDKFDEIIQKKYQFFVENSMLSDCYFYLGYVNKDNFMQIGNTVDKKPDLIHILKIAFDTESDSNLLLEQTDLISKSSFAILDILSKN